MSTRIAVRICAAPPAAESASIGTQLREIVDWAIVHCPVVDAVRRAVPVNLQVTIA